MSDISVSEIGDIVTAKRNVFDAFGIPVACDLDKTAEESESYAFSDIDIRILYLVHGKTMGFDIPHCDTESTDPSRSGDRYDFAPSCFDADGSWKLFPKWISDRIEHECGMFPVDGTSGYININEISAIWHSVNGTEYGRPAWLDDEDDTGSE